MPFESAQSLMSYQPFLLFRRINFSSAEDSVLQLCKAASMYLFSYRVQSKYSLITHTAVRDIINEKFPVSLNISENHFIKLHCIPYKLQIFFCTLFDQYKGANINRTFFYCTGFFNKALDHLLVKSHYSKQIFFRIQR